ncbi:MAG: phosphoenolpyruvate carboxykinase (ATP) [candidate division Zixibacteria bacterium]|nr:phosphoenolpyruvate carboxykinase (ATP) [candidate division Zixibacteria bacterium]
MSDPIYNPEFYGQFAENLRHCLDGPNIEHVKLRHIKSRALKSGFKTKYGSYGWRSAVSSRIGPKTVYLGSPEVRLPKLTPVMRNIVENAPDELNKVLHLMRTLPFVHLKRQMGNNDEYNPTVNLYMSVADAKNYRLAYMYGNTMFKPSNRPGPEFTMIHIPEEHQLRQQVLALPEHHLNICLGSDYMGEDKKGFLRQAMWSADKQGMLGLHAGTKLVYVYDGNENRLKRYGVFLFGLSATGKSTWSCHQLGLDFDKKERTEAIQDDIVFLKPDGSAYGSEANFFVKTDVDPKLQEAMYNALADKSALMENVMVDADGVPDFLDETLCGNGRAVIQKSKLRVKRGRRLVSIEGDSINLPPVSELDGLIFAFITRRNTVMSFAQKLTADQAALAYLWGESSHSAASEPDKAGESVRTVGTDPFIVGSRAKKVNRFYEIIKGLEARFPGKVHFRQYNTGGVGEILKKYQEDSTTKKKLVRKVTRVPIDLMAAIQRGDLRGTNSYAPGIFGTEDIVSCADGDLSPYDPFKMYSKEEIQAYVDDIVEGRRRFTDEVAKEGLKQEILKIAEESFSISSKYQKSAKVTVPEMTREERKDKTPAFVSTSLPPSVFKEPKSRPKRWRA